MHRSTLIVLGKPAESLFPEAKSRRAPAQHWGRWRNGGAALSLLLHVAVLAGLTITLPVFGGPAPPEPETAIPVEVVQRPPEPKTEEKAEEKKPEEKKPEDAKKIPDPVKLEPPADKKPPEPMKPEPPQAERAPPSPAAKTAPPPPPAAAPPKAPPAAPATLPPALPAEPVPSEPAAPPPPSFLPEARLPPAPPPIPEAPKLEPGTKVDADDDAAPPLKRSELGYWVLEPVTVNLGVDRCGPARLTGVLELKERIAPGHYRGTMRTRIAWAACPPEGVLRQVELKIRGGEVEMMGTGGFVDRGVIGQNTMLLEDAFGRSVWKKR